MFLIISNDKRIPFDVIDSEYEVWPINEFIKKASCEEGLVIDSEDGIFFNTAVLSAKLYEELKLFSEVFDIVYYRFSDQPEPLLVPDEGVIVYDVTPPESKEEPKDEQLEEVPVEKEEPKQNDDAFNMANGMTVLGGYDVPDNASLDINRVGNMLNNDDIDTSEKHGDKPGKVILFGSSKGGTGKTFTCLITALRYAEAHPNERIALADFDVIDGQIGININKIAPTLADFYTNYNANNRSFSYLANNRVKSEHFSPNLDFYLAPPMEIPKLTNDTEYWAKVFRLLITNYDTVFFDSGIDYLGKEPISMLYKIADKIIITCNPSINSVKSVIKQLKTLNGTRLNDVFKPENDILSRTFVVLTRVYADDEINNIVVSNISKYTDVIAAFGNIDDVISKCQWYQQWELISKNKNICKYLDIIASIDDNDDE